MPLRRCCLHGPALYGTLYDHSARVSTDHEPKRCSAGPHGSLQGLFLQLLHARRWLLCGQALMLIGFWCQCIKKVCHSLWNTVLMRRHHAGNRVSAKPPGQTLLSCMIRERPQHRAKEIDQTPNPWMTSNSAPSLPGNAQCVQVHDQHVHCSRVAGPKAAQNHHFRTHSRCSVASTRQSCGLQA